MRLTVPYASCIRALNLLRRGWCAPFVTGYIEGPSLWCTACGFDGAYFAERPRQKVLESINTRPFRAFPRAIQRLG